MKKIIFIHSLNNYTGSPNVLSVIIKGFISKGYEVELITSKGRGFLSNLSGVKYRYTCYRWAESSAYTLFLLLFSQIGLFFHILFSPKQHTLYYINTIVPFGAALACWLTKKNYVYHVHENMRQQKPVYFIFRSVYRLCNRKSIFVSNYLRGTALNCKDGRVVYNCLNVDFVSEAEDYRLKTGAEKKITILMAASLRRFKGVYEFAELAKRMPQYPFELVANASEKEVRNFINEVGSIDNLTVYPAQNNLHPFYQRAKLLLQLSHPESCVETFGLTILEAMAYGVPAIVPNVGGPVELVEDGMNGYTVNPLDIETVKQKIALLLNDSDFYQGASEAALKKSRLFDENRMLCEIERFWLSLPESKNVCCI